MRGTPLTNPGDPYVEWGMQLTNCNGLELWRRQRPDSRRPHPAEANFSLFWEQLARSQR